MSRPRRQHTERPHDDWPYLYLTGRTIPMHYIVALWPCCC